MSLNEVQNEKKHRKKGSCKHELEEVWKDCSEHIILTQGMSWSWYLGEVAVYAVSESPLLRQKPRAQGKLSTV